MEVDGPADVPQRVISWLLPKGKGTGKKQKGQEGLVTVGDIQISL